MMEQRTADAVICGAGIAGIAAAYHLTVEHGLRRVMLVDPRPPLSLTSDKSTECYRNWWPGPGSAMVQLMNRSIDLLESWADASGNVFGLNRRGYLYATASENRAEIYRRESQVISELGAGKLRVHAPGSNAPAYQPAPAEGYRDQPAGADLLLDRQLIHEYFPYLSDEVVAVLHARRCGWFSAQQMGNYLLQLALGAGASLVQGEVEGLDSAGGSLRAVRLATSGGPIRVSTDRFLLAAGPMLKSMAHSIGVDLPIFCELHTKISFTDHQSAMPRQAPLLIWSDPQHIDWGRENAAQLADDPALNWLLEPFPAGVHARPEGGGDSQIVLLLWTYDTDPVPPLFPIEVEDQVYPEVAMRGFSKMVPAFADYFDRMPRPFVDGGYYVKTQENRLLASPLPLEGTYVLGALSGYGLMASPAAGELVAAHMTGNALPEYADWFDLNRYQDPDYQKLLADWGSSGQL